MAFNSSQNNDDPFGWLDDPLGTKPKQQQNKKKSKNSGPTMTQLKKVPSTQKQQQIQQNTNFNNSGWDENLFNVDNSTQNQPAKQSQIQQNNFNNSGWDNNFFNVDNSHQNLPVKQPQVQQNLNFNNSGWNDDFFNNQKQPVKPPQVQPNNFNNSGWDENLFNDNSTQKPMSNNTHSNNPVQKQPEKQSEVQSGWDNSFFNNNTSQSNPIDLNFLFDNKTEQKTEQKTNSSENYDQSVVDELFNLGYGSKKQIIAASKKTVNYKDINAVADKMNESQFDEKNNDSDNESEISALNDDNWGFYPKVTKKRKGYKKKKRAETNGYAMSPIKDINDKKSILYLSIDTRDGKTWMNEFKNEELGFDVETDAFKTKLYDSVNDKFLKVYYHDTDPDNKPLLGDFGGKYMIFLYLQTDKLRAEKKERTSKRTEKEKKIEAREHRKWDRDYDGPAWNCWVCHTKNTTRTCSNCYAAETENRTPKQEEIDELNKLKAKLQQVRNVNSKKVKTFCFEEYIQDKNMKGISVDAKKKKFIIENKGNKMSHVVGKKGFNKGRHSIKFKYLNLEKYPTTFFSNIWRVCLTNKCEEDKAGDLFGYRGKRSILWKFSNKTKEVIFSASESGMGFEMGKFWNSSKKVDKNRKYNVVEIIADFDEGWVFCFLNEQLTFHRWKGWGQDLYEYKLLDFPYKPTEEDGLWFWCFECCAGDWPKPISILHCY